MASRKQNTSCPLRKAYKKKDVAVFPLPLFAPGLSVAALRALCRPCKVSLVRRVGWSDRTLSGPQTHLSAFDRGRKAATMSDAGNPFAAGSVDHGNFERGWRFGREQVEQDAAYWRERPDTSRPDFDEGDA